MNFFPFIGFRIFQVPRSNGNDDFTWLHKADGGRKSWTSPFFPPKPGCNCLQSAWSAHKTQARACKEICLNLPPPFLPLIIFSNFESHLKTMMNECTIFFFENKSIIIHVWWFIFHFPPNSFSFIFYLLAQTFGARVYNAYFESLSRWSGATC